MRSVASFWKEWGVVGAAILVVDDDPDDGYLTRKVLKSVGAGEVWIATTVGEALERFGAERPELAIVDYHMPPHTGIDTVSALRAVQRFPEELSIVMQTGSRESGPRHQALTHLVTDFVLKDCDPSEMLLRVGKAIRMHRLVLRSFSENARLEEAVEQRTRQLRQANQETFDRLAMAAALRDEDTAGHTGRVGRLSRFIALALGVEPDEADVLGRAAELHDLGKIGVPDAILRKPGPLTPEERAVMETHAALGASLLEGCADPVLREATTIARSHHERWDGQGYPQRLIGADIPLAGRIVAVADAYDAMTKDRPYRRAMSPETARGILKDGSARQWDPGVVEAFLRG